MPSSAVALISSMPRLDSREVGREPGEQEASENVETKKKHRAGSMQPRVDISGGKCIFVGFSQRLYVAGIHGLPGLVKICAVIRDRFER